MDALPLRERSKLRRRRAIQMAGMRLFAERGYEATTIADIAAAAEVAPRTIFGYFPTKLDIALASTNAAADRLAAAFAATSGRSVVSAFVGWLNDEQGAVDAEERMLRAAMLTANPSLSLSGSVQSTALSIATADALALELGVDVDADAVRVVSGMMLGVLLNYELIPKRRAYPADTLGLIEAALNGAVAEARQHLARN